MNNLVKVLIGVGIVGVVAATTYIVTKKPEKVVQSVDSEGNVESKVVKDDSILDKMKKAAVKKAVKILVFVAEHQTQVEAFVTILGLVGGIFTVVNEIRNFSMGKEMRQKMSFMYNHDMEFEDVWNAHTNGEATRYDEIMKVLNDICQNMVVKEGV